MLFRSNICDENGVPAIMHAVIDNNRAIARLLMKNGANPKLQDRTGRDAASCSRTSEMDDILTSTVQ